MTIVGKIDTVGLTRTDWSKGCVGQVGQEDWDIM